MKYIPLDELVIGECYELESRNLRKGVWDGHAFHGIRYKFGDQFIDSEIHYDLDDHYGTAQAKNRLDVIFKLEIEPQGDCPLCGNTDTGTL